MIQDITIRNCKNCGKEFHKEPTCSWKRWNESRKFCSIGCSKKGTHFKLGKNGQKAWNKVIPQTAEAKKNLSEKLKVISKEKGFGKWMKGKKLSPETRKKQSEATQRLIKEGKHNFYIDGRTPKNKIIRHSLEYKLWREAVFKRDNYTCQWCGKRGVYLHADHIKPFAYFPDSRFAIDNGRTLCRECHYKRHSK